MMTTQADAQLIARLKALAHAASLAVTLIGGLVLFGWVFNISTLKSLWPGLATMKPNTALAFIGVGASLYLSGGKPTLTRQRLAQAGAIFVVLLAFLTLSQDLFGWNLGLDQLLFRDTAAAASTASPGRMSPATALNFTLLGSALLLLDVKRWRGGQVAQLLALVVGIVALVALVGYAYGVQSLYQLTPFSSMALHTAFTFFILTLAILAARPEQGIMASINEQTISGLMLRRLLPAAIILPIVLGGVRLLGQRLGLYDTEMGLTIFALSNVTVFTGLIWWNAQLLQRTDAERRRAEEQFRLMVEASPNAILLVDTAGQINLMNAQAEKLFGYPRQELLGQPVERLVPSQFHAEHQGYRNGFLKTPTTRAMGVGRDLFGVCKDGSQILVEIGLNPITTPEGNFVLVSVIDITERRRAEEALRESESRFRLIADTAPVLIWIADQEALCTFFNKPWLDFTGRTIEQELGNGWAEGVHLDDYARCLDIYLSAFKARQKFSMEYRLRRADGAYRWIVDIGEPRFESDRFVGYIGSCIDITERRQAEAQFRRVVEASPQAILLVDSAGQISLMNAQAEKLFGYTREELLGQPVERLVPAQFHAEHLGYRSVFLKTPTTRAMGAGRDLFGVRKDGSQVPIEIGLNPITTPEGAFVLASIIDITERKRAEDRFRLVVEASPNAIILVDSAGQITLMNAQAEKLFGYPRQELLGQPVERLVPAQFHAEHRGYRNIFLKTPTTRAMGVGRDLFGVRKDGSQVPIEIGLNPITTSEGSFVLASIIDITERKQAEERFRLVVEASPQAIILVSTSGQINLVNTRAEALFGYTRAELLGQPIEMLVPPQFRPQHHNHRDTFFAAPASRAMGAGRDLFGLRKDGSQMPIEIGLNPITTKEGSFVLASIIDITMRKWLEEALRESEARYRRTLDNMLGSCQIIDFDWCYVYLNDAAATQGKRSQAELLGHTMMEIYPGIENTELFTVLGRCMRERSLEHMENKFTYPDGMVNWFELSIQPVPEGIFILSLDISERKQAEESLKQAAVELTRSNAELEQFAYIASHDLQEPLRAIASMLQLLQRRYGGQLDDRADEFIQHAVEGVSRMQTLIADLLNFSRVGTRGQPFQPTDCAEVLSAVLANLAVAIRESQADITHDPLPTVLADHTQLIQLFQNLLSNAIKFCSDDAPIIHIGVEQQEAEYLFTVRDNGVGLEVEYFERIFGIFQRLHTRREYPGTGIGLAVCRKIVERHGGRIWVESEPGQGSIFYFTLPNRR